jgi:plasmid replication initiation protein
MQEVEIRPSDWVFNAIRAKEVLTLHRDYFRLRKPLERRMYELVRKHCEQQATWSISPGTAAKEMRLHGKGVPAPGARIVIQDEVHDHFPRDLARPGG